MMVRERGGVRLLWTGVLAVVLWVLPQAVTALEEYGSAEAERRVLIATEKTSFKSKLVEELVSVLEDDMGYLRVVDHRKKGLDEERAADYSAVVVINSGVNSQVRPWVASWLKGADVRENIILVTTYRDKGWSPRYPEGVDSISTPSRKADVQDLVRDIRARVNAVVAGETEQSAGETDQEGDIDQEGDTEQKQKADR